MIYCIRQHIQYKQKQKHGFRVIVIFNRYIHSFKGKITFRFDEIYYKYKLHMEFSCKFRSKPYCLVFFFLHLISFFCPHIFPAEGQFLLLGNYIFCLFGVHPSKKQSSFKLDLANKATTI